MRKKIYWILSAVTVITVAAAVYLIIGWESGNKIQNTSDGRHRVNLFFSNKEGTKILSEARGISANRDLYTAVIEELIKGPTSPDMQKTIPNDTVLNGLSIDSDTITVDFSQGFNTNFKTGNDALVYTTVIKTLCDLPDIKKVILSVNGENVTDPMGDEDIILGDLPPKQNSIAITLYFADSTGQYLIPEIRLVSPVGSELLESYVVEQLIAGPKDKNLSKTVPSEVKVLSVTTNNDRTCFVNLSQDIKTRHWNTPGSENLTIYSIVNSLTELANISDVQFLIDGKKNDVFITQRFNEPFTRDSSLIKK